MERIKGNSMIHIKEEGKPVYNGFNFYRLSDSDSFGFVFRYGNKIPILNAGFNAGSKIFWFRYSKQSKKWIIGKQ
jgi:phage terminase large subunit-like protein